MMMNARTRYSLSTLTGLGLGLSLSFSAGAQEPYPFTTKEIASFNEPWALEFLPDGHMLVTEKGGKIFLVSEGGDKTEVSGAPQVDYFFQGGLGDIAVHPDFESNRQVYVSYAESGPNETRGAVVARGTLDSDAAALSDLEVIWRAEPKVEGGLHFAYRMVFDRDGHLFVTSGDRNEKAPAQSMESSLGKIMRLNDDGSPAAGNPFADQGGVAAEIWTLGHRNQLGIDIDADGRVWNTEMGPQGGDELNLLNAGTNYGYPEVSNGSDYDSTPIPNHDTRPEFEKPRLWWYPAISPSSLAFYYGDKFPNWQGNAFIGSLSTQAIVRIQLNGENAREAGRFVMGKRIREIEAGPNGYLWYLEDGEGGRLMKMEPR